MRSKIVSDTKVVYLITWFGQSLSLVGSGLTSFALGVWVFERSGSATLFALIGLCAVLPRILLSPLAGAIVDRWDRRWVMALSDAGAGLSTLAAILLAFSNRFEIWHVYLLTVANSALHPVNSLSVLASSVHPVIQILHGIR